MGGFPRNQQVYHRETQELVFDAHDKAFGFYGGVCRIGIYDNMKTAVEAIFIGKARKYNQRFLQMCSRHLVAPRACTPAAVGRWCWCAHTLSASSYCWVMMLWPTTHGSSDAIRLFTAIP